MDYKTFIVAVLGGVVVLAGSTVFGPVKTVVEQRVGALSGPDIPFPYLAWGGVRATQYHTDTLNAASTTACSFQNLGATSTATGAIRLDVSSTSATTVQIGTGAHSNATTTRSGTDVAVAASAKTYVTASSTIVAPNGWFVFALKGGTGTHSPSGVCGVQFTEY